MIEQKAQTVNIAAADSKMEVCWVATAGVVNAMNRSGVFRREELSTGSVSSLLSVSNAHFSSGECSTRIRRHDKRQIRSNGHQF